MTDVVRYLYRESPAARWSSGADIFPFYRSMKLASIDGEIHLAVAIENASVNGEIHWYRRSEGRII